MFLFILFIVSIFLYFLTLLWLLYSNPLENHNLIVTLLFILFVNVVNLTIDSDSTSVAPIYASFLLYFCVIYSEKVKDLLVYLCLRLLVGLRYRGVPSYWFIRLYNLLWDLLFDKIRSYHSFHTSCTFTHVGTGLLPRVRTQVPRGSNVREFDGYCAAFATTSALSYLIRSKLGLRLMLAVQPIIDSLNFQNGVETGRVYDFLIANGALEEHLYPFVGRHHAFINLNCTRYYFTGGMKYFPEFKEDVINELRSSVPSAQFRFFKSYNKYKFENIMSAKEATESEGWAHAVICTGYGFYEEDEEEEWFIEIQNSHDLNWGFFGMGKIAADNLSHFRAPLDPVVII